MATTPLNRGGKQKLEVEMCLLRYTEAGMVLHASEELANSTFILTALSLAVLSWGAWTEKCSSSQTPLQLDVPRDAVLANGLCMKVLIQSAVCRGCPVLRVKNPLVFPLFFCPEHSTIPGAELAVWWLREQKPHTKKVQWADRRNLGP